jgi:tetratricopeptide (TPR) repeat protein
MSNILNQIRSHLIGYYCYYFLAKRNKYNKALNLLNKATKIAPDVGYPYFLKAYCFGKLDNYSESIEELEKLLSLNQKHSEKIQLRIFEMLSYACVQVKNYIKAEKYYKEELSFKPKDYLTHSGLAKVLLEQNKIDEAIIAFETSFNINQNDDYSLLHLARLYSDKDKYEKSLYYTNEYLRIKPNDLKVLNCKVQLLEALNKNEEAADLKKNVESITT